MARNFKKQDFNTKKKTRGGSIRRPTSFAFKENHMSKKKNYNVKDSSQKAQSTKLNFILKHISPLTQNQKLTFSNYEQNKNLLLIGSAGSGKTFLSTYLALRELLDETISNKKLYICRSAEPSKNVGFLPGSIKEKIKIYESPYYPIFTQLFDRSDAYEYLKNKGMIEFISTSYVRGLTFDDCIIIVDEVQNLEWNELYAIMTRIGQNCRIIFCGDYRQSDLKNNYRNDNRKDDILKFIDVIKKMLSFKTIEFTHDDIVRSSIVKEFIITSENLGL
jgi:phosphate starvation-inducible protein PhoH